MEYITLNLFPHLKTYSAEALIGFYYSVFSPTIPVSLPLVPTVTHLLNEMLTPEVTRPLFKKNKAKGNRVIGQKFPRTTESLRVEKAVGQPPRKKHRTEEWSL